jgi:hypothetical protein
MRTLFMATAYCMLVAFSFAQNELPIVGSWNTGQFQRTADEDAGFDPNWQLQRILDGDPMVPSFEMWEKYARQGTRESRSIHFQKLWSVSRQFKLPVSFIGENWEDYFRLNAPWKDMRTADTDDHPFIEYADGSRPGLAGPFGDNLHHWYDLGLFLGSYMEREFAADYPDCPRICLYNNAEVGIAKRGEELNDIRCPDWYKEASAENRAIHLRRQWRIRRGELIAGIKAGCPTWADRIEVYAYGSFADEFGSGDLAAWNPRRYETPWATAKLPYNSASWVGYVHSWQTWEIDTTRSPPIQACNARWALEQIRKIDRPGFQLEAMYWNGKQAEPGAWKGVVRQVMWTTQVQNHRLFTSSAQTRADTLVRDYEPLIEAAREIHENETLRRFWQHGTLLTNRWSRDYDLIPKLHPNDTTDAYGHPYHWSRALPPEWSDPGDRWYQQHVPINNRFIVNQYGNRMIDAWQVDRAHIKPVYVWAICYQLGDEYLLITCAPRGAVQQCEIQVCPDGGSPRFTSVVDVSVSGDFYLVSADGTATRIAGDPVPDPVPVPLPIPEEQQ